MAVTGNFSHGTPQGVFEELSTLGEARMECQQPMSDAALEEAVCEMERGNPWMSTV